MLKVFKKYKYAIRKGITLKILNLKLINMGIIAATITASAGNPARGAAARYYGPVRFHITKKKPVQRPVFAHTNSTVVDNACANPVPDTITADIAMPEKALQVLVGSKIIQQTQIDTAQIIDASQIVESAQSQQTTSGQNNQASTLTAQQSEEEIMYMFNALIENWLLGLIPKSFTLFAEELIHTMTTYKKALTTEQLRTAIMQFMKELDSIKNSRSVFQVGKVMARYKKYLPAYSRIHQLGFFKLKELLTERLAIA
jgi:hypothetical protein